MASQADFKNREFLAVIGDEVSVGWQVSTSSGTVASPRMSQLTCSGFRHGFAPRRHRRKFHLLLEQQTWSVS